MDNDIHHKFEPGFAAGFANVPNGDVSGLVWRLQSLAFSGEDQPVDFRAGSLYCFVGMNEGKL
jgi:hypothetical protein